MKAPKDIVIEGGNLRCYKDNILGSAPEKSCVIIPELSLETSEEVIKLIKFLFDATLWLQCEEKLKAKTLNKVSPK